MVSRFTIQRKELGFFFVKKPLVLYYFVAKPECVYDLIHAILTIEIVTKG